jgi:FkbM family methyltransferase
MHRIETMGFTLLLHGDNYLEEEILRSGVWEPPATQYMQQALKPGMVAVDVGANIGYFSFLMAHLVGRQGRVHAFEPYPGYVDRMCASLAVNDFEQIELHQVALSDRWGTQTLYKGLASARMCRWSHSDPAFNKVHDTVTIACMPFDDYAREGLDRLDLIKIDVDGHEMKVLQGARGSIERYKPAVLIELYEEALRDAGSSVDEVLEFFDNRAFVPFSEQGQPLDLRELSQQAAERPKVSTNVVFRPRQPASISIPQESVPVDARQAGDPPVLGLVLNRQFHEENRWCSATTYHLVEEIKRHFQCVYIEDQQDYEKCLGDLDVLLSMEPGWAAPRLEFVRTPESQVRLAAIPSYILYSDPHANQWRQEYFLSNRLDYVLSYYRAPFLRHFRQIPPDRMIHFPWAIPDDWISQDPIRFSGQRGIACFGASQGPAYSVRNWCRGFPFVTSTANSGVENKLMSDLEYVEWLRRHDAAIAAGSDAPQYRLTVPKYFEIAAAGALLFAQETDDLECLGFRHMENCVIFNRSNFEALARQYLSRPQDYLAIRQNGRELVRERHSLSQRIDALQQHIAEARSRKRKCAVTPVQQSEYVPHLLFIVDSPNWAHDFKTDHIMRALKDSYLMRKRCQSEVDACDIAWADLIVAFYWKQFNDENMQRLMPVFRENRRKLLIGISSHQELMGKWREPGVSLLRELAAGIFVNNLLLYRQYGPQFEQSFFYTPNGVDTAFFTPGGNERRGGPLRVGWAGSLTNHGLIRGYEEYIVPAVQMVEGAELVTAAREDQWRGPEQMRDFYRSLDVYVCASSAEGTPNTCLEAAACGVPLVTTRVGNMPELVQDGANGFFAERDVRDIAEKLARLRDMPALRGHLGQAIRASVMEWDWDRQAQHYRAMFDAMLHADGRAGSQPFRSESQLYLASADRMDKVLANLRSLDGLPDMKLETYATVIGGLSGLNYLLRLEPRRIAFFDINPSAVRYARLVCQMIAISDGPRHFISRMFGRSVDAWLDSTGLSDLTVDNQTEYLATGVDEALVRDTLSRLSPSNRETFETYILPHLTGGTRDGVRNCRRLLPCWPIDERVPVGAGESLGRDERGSLVPNTNTFFYGHGWLGSPQSFQLVKLILAQASVSFHQFDLFQDDLRCLGDLSQSFILHASNMDDWFADAWAKFKERAASLSLSQQGSVATVTLNGGVWLASPDVHARALAGIRPYIFGRTVEVTHKTPWGFGELDRTNMAVNEYLASNDRADTTILHILLGEGVERSLFERAYRSAVHRSSRVIVLEHNRDSRDWVSRNASEFVSAADLTEAIRKMNEGTPAVIHTVQMLAGERDLQRNILVVVDVPQALGAAGLPSEPVVQTEAGAARCTMCPPDLSVVLTTYNRPELLEQVLDGFAAQTAPRDDFEVIVVDDGSVPPVRAVAEKFAGAMHLKYLRQANRGLAAARNAGIHAAEGAIVLFSDDDDVPSPELIAEHLASHRAYPDECIAVLGHLDWHPDLNVTPLMHYVTRVGGEYFGFDRLQDGQLYDQWKWWGGLVSAKRSLLESVEGPFDARLRFGYEDTELMCRLLPRQIRVLYNANALSYVLRPVTFQDFCARSCKQGRALHRVAAAHPEIIIPRYALEEAEKEYAAKYTGLLEQWAGKVSAFEALLATQVGPPAERHLQALYTGYRECFRGYLLKGYIEQLQASNRGEVSLSDPVNGESDASARKRDGELIERPLTQTVNDNRTMPRRRDSRKDESPVKAPARPLRIAFVDTNTPCYDMGSSSQRIHQIVKILVARGHRIDYLYTKHFKSDGKYKAAYDGAVTFVKILPTINSIRDYLHFNHVDDLDCVWITNLWALDYTEFAIELAQWLRENRPRTKIIVDTMDLHYKKHMRRFELSGDPQDRETATRFLELERKLYPLADRVLAVTEVEKRDILAQMPAPCNVEVVPNIHDVLPEDPPLHRRRHMCFLGAFRIGHNLDAVIWFVKQVYPRIVEKAPAVEFHILGHGNESFRETFEAYPNVKVIGYVENAEQAVAQYRLFICPMIYGAGMKGKLGTAAAAGTPFVTTTIGAEGFDFIDGQHCFIAADPAEFADECLRLLQDDAIWARFHTNSRDLLSRRFSVEAVGRTIDELLGSVASEPPKTPADSGRAMSHVRVDRAAAGAAPKVSIVTACHNSEQCLPECLDSIVNQTLSEWELFLLDDNSTDGTRRIIEDYSRRDRRIKPYCFNDNRGPYTRRKFAIARANSPFIVIQDADDIMSPAKLEILYREIMRDPRLAMVGSFYRTFLDQCTGLQYAECSDLPEQHEDIVARFVSWRHAMSHGSAIIRKVLFDEIGPYDENPWASDAFWSAKLGEYIRRGAPWKVRNIPEYLTLIRVHTTNQMQQLPAFDPRSRSMRYHQYCEVKLRKIREKVGTVPGTDIGAELRNCDCSDFLTRFKTHIIKWESEPLQDHVVQQLLDNSTWQFNHACYVGCVSMLSGIEVMEPGLPRKMVNLDLVKAMALYALGLKERALKYLRREIEDHGNCMAKQFYQDYFELGSKMDVQRWCAEHKMQFKLQAAPASPAMSHELPDEVLAAQK